MEVVYAGKMAEEYVKGETVAIHLLQEDLAQGRGRKKTLFTMI